MRRALLGLAAAMLVLAGCGDDDDVETSTDSTAEPTETTEAPEGSDGTGTSSSTTATRAPAGEPAPQELPGERLELFPQEGAALAVVGVAADDVLNVRAAPGTQYQVVAEAGPLADDLTATGHNRQLDDGSIWNELTIDGTTGWASSAFLAQLGATDDITSALWPDPAARPTAETMVQLGQAIAQERAGAGEPQPDVVVVDGPTVGDLGEITVDVVGYPDDAVLGERLRVFAEPDTGGESFTVRTVEATTLCRRGVSGQLCL